MGRGSCPPREPGQGGPVALLTDTPVPHTPQVAIINPKLIKSKINKPAPAPGGSLACGVCPGTTTLAGLQADGLRHGSPQPLATSPRDPHPRGRPSPAWPGTPAPLGLQPPGRPPCCGFAGGNALWPRSNAQGQRAALSRWLHLESEKTLVASSGASSPSPATALLSSPAKCL